MNNKAENVDLPSTEKGSTSLSKDIAFLGVMSALFIVIFTLETIIGSVGPTPPAILSLSFLFVICFSKGWKIGALSGAILGVSSFLIAWIVGNPLFIFPWISILPRLLVGVIAYATFALFRKVCKNAKSSYMRESFCYAIGAGVGIIVNTLFVILALTFFAPAKYGNTFVYWVQAVITLNFPFELVVSVLLVPLLSIVVNRIYKNKGSE